MSVDSGVFGGMLRRLEPGCNSTSSASSKRGLTASLVVREGMRIRQCNELEEMGVHPGIRDVRISPSHPSTMGDPFREGETNDSAFFPGRTVPGHRRAGQER